VQVVAPRATPRYRGGRAQRTSPRKRKFHDVDLANCFLVVAATSSSKLHKRIFDSQSVQACSAMLWTCRNSTTSTTLP
jgi:siroheme synthase (precorrin-2 oxidase/ferrochelatase)